MGNSLGMVELSSIARGIETCDYMIKAAEVKLVRTGTVCPGKYIILIAGEIADINASMKIGMEIGDACVIDTLIIPNIHPQVIQAISMTNQVTERDAVGVLEFYSAASAVRAADIAVKAAGVTLIEVQIGYGIGGKGFVTLTGDVGAVRAAVASAKEESDLLVNTAVVPRPAPQLFEALL